MGLVLGAGGTVGHAYHAGTLAALAEAGWDARGAELIVGTSVGAVTGALLRAGVSPADLYARVTGGPVSAEGRRILEAADRWPTLVCDMKVGPTALGRPASPRLLAELVRHPSRTRAGLLLAGVTPTGPVSTAPIALELNRLFAGTWPAEPLWVCAVELDTGRRVVLGTTSGPATDVGTAVAASSAAPSLFQPVIVDGSRLVDGGLHSPANADVAADFPGELDALVVSLPMGLGGRPGRLGVDLPGRLLNHLLTARELVRVRRAGVAVAVYEPGASELELMHYNAFELEGRDEIAARAYRAALHRLDTAASSESPLAAVADAAAS